MGKEASEFARGWPILAASFVGIAIGVSSLFFYSLGIFIKPLAAEFGWSRGEASLGALAGTICAAIMSFPMGQLIDRIGSVRVAIGSLLLLAVSFAALGALTTGLASFLAIVIILSLLTAGATPLPFTRLVVAAFEKNRGLALGLTLSGTGMGAILIPALLPPFIENQGWRAGYFALGGIVLLVLPLLILLLRSAPEAAPVRVAASAQISRIVGSRIFALLGVIFFSASMAVFGAVVHFVPMLTDAGFSPARAGQTAALIGVAAIVGRLAAGWLLDRLPPQLVTAGLFGIASLGLALLAVGGAGLAVPGALIIGLSVGAEVDLMAFLTGRYFPRAVYGQTYGALYALFLIGGAIGPALSGYLFDVTDDYRLSLLTAAVLLAMAAFLATRLSIFPAAKEAAPCSA